MCVDIVFDKGNVLSGYNVLYDGSELYYGYVLCGGNVWYIVVCYVVGNVLCHDI